MHIQRWSLGLPVLLALVVPSAGAAAITPANVAGLVPKWDFRIGFAVTSSPVVANGLVYVTSWKGTNENIFALDAVTGAAVWSYAAGASLQGTIVLAPGGKACFGDSRARVHCLDAAAGDVMWITPVGDSAVDHIWSGLGMAAGRLFAGIASHSDNPCAKGRVVALDLASGEVLWTVQAVPERICDTDTRVECTSDEDCDGGTCVEARGAGVTASPLADPTGRYVYMNTVGCYTFPSVGDSDSVFKIDAATGEVLWKTRVDAPEQFGFCENDPSLDCGTDAMCGPVGGVCTIPKPVYHDFGFLNGPLLVEVDDGGGTRALVISGSKNGTLYAFDEGTGTIAWTHEVRAKPVTPGFAGFGLFNGAIAHADGRIYAALGSLVPARVCAHDTTRGCRADSDCGGALCLPAPDHLMAFDARDGSTVWSADDIGPSWAHVGVSDGVLYTGAGTFSGGPEELFAYDAGDGTLLARFPMPEHVISRPTVDGNSLYVGYGIAVPGGILAFSLCGNGAPDDGEECDDGRESAGCDADCTFAACGDGRVNASAGEECDDGGPSAACGADCTLGVCGDGRVGAGEECDDGNTVAGDCCSASCRHEEAGAVCAPDGSECTADRCDGAGVCAHQIADVACAVGEIVGVQACGAERLPKKLAKTMRKKAKRAERLLAKAAKLEAKGRDEKASVLRVTAIGQLETIDRKVAAAAELERISRDCETAIDALITPRRQAIVALVVP
jgi:cysteine-rich repeat protein